MKNLQIEEKHLKIVQDILRKYPYNFYVFGSRIKGNATKYSDLDLAYDIQIPNQELVKIETSFSESDLPYKVDIIDLNNINLSFRNIISKDLQSLELK